LKKKAIIISLHAEEMFNKVECPICVTVEVQIRKTAFIKTIVKPFQ